MILETVEDYADLLGGAGVFRRNMALTRIGEGWATGHFAIYLAANKSITLDYQWYITVIGQRPGRDRFEIYLCQPDIEDMLGFPEGSLPGVELQAKYVLAHEMSHAFHTGNYWAFKDFEDNVDLPWAVFAGFNSNPLIRRNAGRDGFRFEVFADVLAAYLYSPTLLNQDMVEWVEDRMPSTLR